MLSTLPLQAITSSLHLSLAGSGEINCRWFIVLIPLTIGLCSTTMASSEEYSCRTKLSTYVDHRPKRPGQYAERLDRPWEGGSIR